MKETLARRIPPRGLGCILKVLNERDGVIEKQVILEGRAGSLHKERQFVNFYLDI